MSRLVGATSLTLTLIANRGPNPGPTTNRGPTLALSCEELSETQHLTLSELALTPPQPLTQPEVVKAEDDTDEATRTPDTSASTELSPAGTTTYEYNREFVSLSSLLMCRDCIWLCAHFLR